MGEESYEIARFVLGTVQADNRERPQKKLH